tara:strand:+ start:709 stop:1053 length:345 start_codon:yes stop_codon:yes gene_type:complete
MNHSEYKNDNLPKKNNLLLMSDGRNFTEWKTRSQIDSTLSASNNMRTDWEYRNFLQKNADSIIKKNREIFCDHCCNCPDPRNAKNNFKLEEESDLKTLYKSREELNDKLRFSMM